jgi:hypothetical protein
MVAMAQRFGQANEFPSIYRFAVSVNDSSDAAHLI